MLEMQGAIDLEFQVLGALQVVRDGVPLRLPAGKPRALLALLVIHANELIGSATLIDLLWGEAPPETAQNALQVYVSQLRAVLEPDHVRGSPYNVLVSQPPGYRLRVPPGGTDIDRFDNLVQEGRHAMAAGAPETAAGAFRGALNLWRGTALVEFAEEQFAMAPAVHLNERRLCALEDRIEADMTLGRHGDLVGELEALVSEHPLRERFSYQLMLALYQSGRQADATEHYRRTRRSFVDELGLEPGPMLQGLLAQILKQDPKLALGPPPSLTATSLSNLPAQVTPFVGRLADTLEVTDLLARSRLVTLTGAGGIGKTRLALEVATRWRDEFGVATRLVEFAPVVDPTLVPDAVMSALGLSGESGAAGAGVLSRHLAGHRQLLLFDNCEHLVDAIADLAASLLRTCPELRILATSREALGSDGETVWLVPSLSTPDRGDSPQALVDFDAVALFCECAGRSNRGFKLTPAVAPAVAEICRTLDGIPLAIELATSRLNVLSVSELRDRLRDGVPLLVTGRKTAESRHRTLHATIAWSHDLLTPAEQAVFRAASVFAGGLTLTAAEAVCHADTLEADVIDVLGRLVDKSLILPPDWSAGAGRFGILEILRQFGRDRLLESGEAPRAEGRHAEYFAGVATQLGASLRGPEQVRALDCLEVEHDNIRAALVRSRERSSADCALRILGGSWLFWYLRGYVVEGLRWATELVPQFERTHPLLGAALVGASHLAWHQRELATAEQWASEALAYFDARQDKAGRGLALLCLANARLFEGNATEIGRRYSEALASLRAAGEDWGASIALNNLGDQAKQDGRYEEAQTYLAESLECGARIQDPWRMGMALSNLASLHLTREMLGQAVEEVIRCFLLQRDGRNLFLLDFELELASQVASVMGEPGQALRFSAAADRCRSLSGAQAEPDEAEASRHAIEVARGALGAEAAELAWHQGAAMTTAAAIEYALGWLQGVRVAAQGS